MVQFGNKPTGGDNLETKTQQNSVKMGWGQIEIYWPIAFATLFCSSQKMKTDVWLYLMIYCLQNSVIKYITTSNIVDIYEHPL